MNKVICNLAYNEKTTRNNRRDHRMGQRLVYFDWLRVWATIAVVTIHVSAEIVWENLFSAPQSYWLSGNFYESLTRASVPIFVMISGALLLRGNTPVTYKSFLLKRVSKIFIPLFFWSFIYYTYDLYRGYHEGFSLVQFMKLFFTNGISVHFWFMYMILGLYLTTPIIKIFIQKASKKDIEYFLILWLYASVIVKYMKYHFGFSINLELYHVTNYVGYFVLGYYLTTFDLKRNWRIVGYAAGAIGLALTFLLTYFDTRNSNGALQAFWYEYHSPNVLLSAIGIFILAKYTFSSKVVKLPLFFDAINNVSFGIYLVHILVLDVFANEIFNKIEGHLHPFLSVPMSVLISVFISGVLTFILSKIPILKKLVP
jgi:surface polysaccharide O-acyltransferase-like enzyme